MYKTHEIPNKKNISLENHEFNLKIIFLLCSGKNGERSNCSIGIEDG